MATRPILRPHLFTRFTRAFATSAPRPASSFRTGPSPQRLPKEEQEIFEELQRRSTGAFSTPRDEPTPSTTAPSSRPQIRINQSPHSASADSATEEKLEVKVRAEGEGEELHPDVRRGAKPEFEGEVNPKTGEVGGPKNEPLRWGAVGDWSYNGRVTDF